MTSTTAPVSPITRVQVRRQRRPYVAPALDLRTPSGRQLPY
jgi:hypothetical protein